MKLESNSDACPDSMRNRNAEAIKNLTASTFLISAENYVKNKKDAFKNHLNDYFCC